MGKITFILGGARSGKSVLASKMAKRYTKVAFIATGQALDKEMKERILLHQKQRPGRWKTFEEPRNLNKLLSGIGDAFGCILIDCLTLLTSNLILARYKKEEIFKRIEAMLAILKKKKARVIIVSNEVGLGLVPVNKLGRDFRDVAGRVNQIAAKEAGEVFFMVSGIPIKIKGGK